MPATGSVEPQTLMLTNARVYTSDVNQPIADTIVVRGERIAFVGARAGAPVDAPVIDLGGRAIVPGFVDAHTHPGMVSQSRWHVRLPWTTDVEELLTFMRQYARDHSPQEAPFLYFEYYPSTMFQDAPPTKELLDSAIADRPVLCQDFNDHEHWVNSRMLELMEIGPETPDPVPGLEMFVRDDDGEPTGLLREHVHLHFIDRMFEKLQWAPPTELTTERIAPFFQFMASHGVAALLDAVIPDETFLASLAELDSRGELNLYYEGAHRFRDLEDLPEVIAQVHKDQARFGSRHIRINTLKLFLDGTNEIGNSAVLESMCNHDSGDDRGQIALEVAELTDCLLLANAEGVDVHVHLVGDRAFRTACDAVEAAQTRLRAGVEPWRIQVTLAHCELVDPADMARPAQLGIIINWTPHWSGGYFGEGAIAHLGRERWDRMYRFNEMADSGATLSFSSDVVTAYEMHRGAPVFGMQVAHTRVDPEFTLDAESFAGGVRPEPSAILSRSRLLAGYTLHGARQLRIDHELGSIEAGKLANLSILSDDLFEVPADRLREVACDAVLFEGRLVAGVLPAARQDVSDA